MIPQLLEKIEALFEQLEKTPSLKQFPHRVEVDIAELSPLDWLVAHDKFERVYWESRETRQQIAGLGIADCISSISRCQFEEWESILGSRFCLENQAIRYFGGFRFPSHHVPSPDWEKFGYYRFVLPLFVLERKDSRSTLSCNIFIKSYYSLAEQLAFIKTQLSRVGLEVKEKSTLPAYHGKIEHTPSKALWEDCLKEVKVLLKTESLDKVVLARKTKLWFEPLLDPCTILQHLPSESSFKYLFQVSPDESFIGSSPECLYTRTHNQISTEAIAGTKSRGKTKEEDIAIEQELKNSPKDQEEHHYVSKMIEAILSPLCQNLTSSNVEVIKLSQVQHLYQKFSGILNSGVTDADLLKALYPTPAVAGYPVKKALELITEEEPFDRGWYAGLVGCVGPNFTQFAVGIRSAHLKEKSLSLFAGAGIVNGSDAQLEWLELNHKIAPYLALFGLI